MKFNEFMSDLKKGKPKQVYLLAGAESYFIDRAREKLLSLLFEDKAARRDGLTVLDCDNKIDISEIIAVLDTAPLFVEKNVVLIKNATLFKSRSSDDADKSDAKAEQLIKVLSNMIETNYAIFMTNDTPDKRKKLYKTITKIGGVLEAEQLKSYQLEPWLNDKLKSLKMTMDTDARQYFTETAAMMPEISLGLLDNELDKVALYVKGDRIKRKELQNVLADLPEISNFALIDAIGAKDLQKAMRLLELQNDDVKNVMITMALLVRQVRMLMRAKHFMSKGVYGKALGEPLGMNPFIAQKTGEAAKKFTAPVLEEALLELAAADYGLKTGTAGAEVLEHAVMKLIRS